MSIATTQFRFHISRSAAVLQDFDFHVLATFFTTEVIRDPLLWDWDPLGWLIVHPRMHVLKFVNETLHVLYGNYSIMLLWLQAATLIGMWVIPIFLCIKFEWWRFIIVWIFFSLVTGLVTFKATRKPLSGSTPRYEAVTRSGPTQQCTNCAS